VKVTRGRTYNISDLTIDADIAMATYKLTGLGAPAAQNDSLRYAQAEIRNAEVKSDAAIAESKLALTVGTSTLNTKIGTDIATHNALKTGIHGEVLVLKASDEVVNNSTTLQNDDELFIPVGIDEIWAVFLQLRLITPSASPNHKIAFVVPNNGVFSWIPFKPAGQGAVALTTGSQPITTGAAEVHGPIWGIYIGGDTAGNLQLQWAQNAAAVEDTKILANSYLRAHRLA